MTVPLSPGSPRRVLAERFGVELDRAMRARRVGANAVEAQLGVAHSSIAAWRAGRNLPRIETAQRLASGLDAPRLLAIVLEARTCRCESCGRAFTNQGGAAKRFCDARCRSEAGRVRHAMGSVPRRADVAERRLREHRAAVGAMCASCEPEGMCVTPACALRPVSPLPLARRRDDAPSVVPPPGPWGDRDAMLATVRAANARRWSRDGERERHSEGMRARYATPEQRTEHGRRVSEGRGRAT